MKVLILAFVLFLNFSPEGWFEGKIRYQIFSVDNEGKPVDCPIHIEDVYYSNSWKITKVIDGDFRNMVGDYFLLIDLERKARIEIWPKEERIVDIGKEPRHDVYYSINKTSENESVLGYTCSLYKIKRKDKSETDTVFIDLYASDKLQIQFPLQLVEVAGNQSTDGIDGSISGVPLRIVIQNKTGVIKKEAIDIKKGKLIGSTEKYFRDLKIMSN